MKKVILFAMFIILTLTTCATFTYAQNVEKGDTAAVPNWEWVDVMNSDSEMLYQFYTNGRKTINYGDTCGIECGGTVTVVGIDGDRLLVRYTASGNPMGMPCPTGTFFFVTKKKFRKMTKEYAEIEQSQDDEQTLVYKLLEDE